MDQDKVFRPQQKLDPDLQKEIDESLGDMNLEDLVDAEQGKAPRRAKADDKLIRGTVVSIQADDIFVDVGGRSEGLLPATQYSEDEELPAEGDTVEVTIEGFDRDGMLRLSRKGAIEQAAWDTLEKGQIVEGRVTGMNKGGLEMQINNIRAFMPVSQIDLIHVEELDGYLNEKLQCEVVEVDRREKNLVVSRRALLKHQAAEQAQTTWKEIHEGKVVQGKVRTIMPYGAFVDIGGVDGLLHVKDMAHGHVDKPEDIVQPGQTIEVRVLSIDRDNEKIGLGLKQTQPDPWEGAEGKWPADSIVTGRIVKLMDFGAFCEVEAGVEGLIPISEFSHKHIGHPKEIVSAGDVVKVHVMRVEPDRKRLTLSMKRAEADPWEGASVRWPTDEWVEGTITRMTDFGAFVELSAGVEGLIHISQLSESRVPSVASVVSQGQTVKARVLEVDEQRRRISLSLRKDTPTSEPTEGTMADLEKIQQKDSKKKNLKGGLDAGQIETPFGELRLG
jgi:small subunit ribosomal protein S1